MLRHYVTHFDRANIDNRQRFSMPSQVRRDAEKIMEKVLDNLGLASSTTPSSVPDSLRVVGSIVSSGTPGTHAKRKHSVIIYLIRIKFDQTLKFPFVIVFSGVKNDYLRANRTPTCNTQDYNLHTKISQCPPFRVFTDLSIPCCTLA